MSLFNENTTGSAVRKANNNYSAQDIEVLEGLEPVRRRPGMYIGGTDEKALYHLISEVLDNAMDEAVAGFANKIQIHLSSENTITITDNGRGIPVDAHPKFPKKSALEVILTTLHSGGKFNNKVYATSGGLHGVGVSVVNALSDSLTVKVKRDGFLYQQHYSRGLPLSKLTSEEIKSKGNGTSISYHPDPEIFKNNKYKAANVYRLACSKAYLFKGVVIEWSCDESLLGEGSDVPSNERIHYPNGLEDYLHSIVPAKQLLGEESFSGDVEFPGKLGKVEWAVNWLTHGDSINRSYCNTIYTPLGGTHESGLKSALVKGLKNYAEISGNKKANLITADDVIDFSVMLLSVFIGNPTFQGQTKDRLLTTEAAKLVENAIRHQFDHWLTNNTKKADSVLELVISSAEARLRRKKEKEVGRKNPIKSLRLPGKLTDCIKESSKDTEIFLVEGESAGGSAKQARNRENQAILPLKGKILNVASNTIEKIAANQEISDLTQALGCGFRSTFDISKLRYEKIIIMTDADVDGAHITSLLLTFFYLQMPKIITNGHLYLAQPPLYKLTQSAVNYYAQTDEEKEKLYDELSKKRGNIEVSRFKGLGEMTPTQLKETTMDPKKRTLLKVMIADDANATVASLVEDLMGKNPEPRFRFIKENASKAVENFDI